MELIREWIFRRRGETEGEPAALVVLIHCYRTVVWTLFAATALALLPVVAGVLALAAAGAIVCLPVLLVGLCEHVVGEVVRDERKERKAAGG